MEVIKAYRIPIKAPIDLIESYFEVKRKALNEIFKYVKFSKGGKTHLDLTDCKM